MKQSDLYIADTEARSGCQKFLKLPGQVAPVRINLPPGMKNGQRLVINNAQFYDKGGIIATIPVSVMIYVQSKKFSGTTYRKGALTGKKKWIPIVLVALICIVFIAASSQGGSHRLSGLYVDEYPAGSDQLEFKSNGTCIYQDRYGFTVKGTYSWKGNYWELSFEAAGMIPSFTRYAKLDNGDLLVEEKLDYLYNGGTRFVKR